MATDQVQLGAAERRKARLTWVRRLRYLLPLAAVAVVVLVAAQVGWREFRFVTAKTPGVKDGTVRMVNPAFRGEGKDGKRYVVTAAAGVRDDADPQVLRLDRPAVTVSGGDEAAARTVANRGVFRQDDLTLRLDGDVRTEQNGRSVFVADNSVIDTTTGRITGQGIQATRTASAVRSDSYTITDSGDRVVFKGGVRARLNAR